MNHDRVVEGMPSGDIYLPSSKSVAHRAVICAALAEGESFVKNISYSRDIDATISCMQALGAEIHREGKNLRVRGGTPKTPTVPLDCDESGSTLRFLIPLVATAGGGGSFLGRGRLMQRPLAPYREALSGVKLEINGDRLDVSGSLQAGSFLLPGNVSSQFVSGLLLALPLVSGDSRIVIDQKLESAAYVDLTIMVMEQFGVKVDWDRGKQEFHVPGNQRYCYREYEVEADYSQAAFFLVAAALGADCRCMGLLGDSRQGDRKIIDILRECGAKVRGSEGCVKVTAGRLDAVTVDVGEIPDLVPPLAVLMCFCKGTSRIVNAARLRLKESDRLTAMTQMLTALGGNVQEFEDSLVIYGVERLKGGTVETYGDHRIAMAAAVAAVKAEEVVVVRGSDCVNKSYPDFWKDWTNSTHTS